MLKIPNTAKIDIMSASNPPAAFCGDGDTVIFETCDCFDGAVTREGVRDWEGRDQGKYMANPATGPLYVEGAQPGDALCVEILRIETRGWGAMGTGYGIAGFKNIAGPRVTRSFEYPVILRAVNTVDAMTATVEYVDWPILAKIADRILKEVPGCNRVLYDMTQKPPATIEWE